MKFLFESITLVGLDHFTIEYMGLPKTHILQNFLDQPGIGFHFHNMKGEWITDDPDKQYEAEQFGGVITDYDGNLKYQL